MEFYTSIFKDAKIVTKNMTPDGKIFTGTFEIAGNQFHVMNGGPHFKFNEAISLSVGCETQAEVDYLWEKLSAGGVESQCGWLKDKFGLSWQITPRILIELMNGADKAKAGRVMQAMMKMGKIDIETLKNA